jgi:hypothetical protein|tara:strand:+ start:727 stop:993 length:267 start_codon:yes stop_codon:yes gene_type:complete
MSKRHGGGAIRELKKGNYEKSLTLIIATLIQHFEANDWKGARVSDLISMLVLLRGTQVKSENGSSPVDNWLVSIQAALPKSSKKSEDE